MRDIAILTKYYKNYNYGGMLQGYALHKVISMLGYSVDLVSYDVRQNSNPVYVSLIQQCKQYGLRAAIYKSEIRKLHLPIAFSPALYIAALKPYCLHC